MTKKDLATKRVEGFTKMLKYFDDPEAKRIFSELYSACVDEFKSDIPIDKESFIFGAPFIYKGLIYKARGNSLSMLVGRDWEFECMCIAKSSSFIWKKTIVGGLVEGVVMYRDCIKTEIK